MKKIIRTVLKFLARVRLPIFYLAAVGMCALAAISGMWLAAILIVPIILLERLSSILLTVENVRNMIEQMPGQAKDIHAQRIGAHPSMGITPETEMDEKTQTFKPKTEKVHLSDVKGIDSITEDCLRCINALKNQEEYRKAGVVPPKGLLLYGPPGTGKTLLARAIASESGIPFISANGSDFIEMYQGVGASRVRELYRTAREHAPCIVFIDEIDAIGGQREAGSQSGETNRTVNAFLSELDGVAQKGGHDGVFTICATNRLDILDSALTRSGRFDLKLAVPLPDKAAREEIFRIHSANKTLNSEISVKDWAVKTRGFSGADISTLLNEAGMLAVEKNNGTITNNNLEDAFFKIVMKGGKKANSDDNSVNIIAHHEAGHAVVGKLLANKKLTGVTIIGSTSGAGGVTFFGDEENSSLPTREDLFNEIRTLYGGRAAEEILLGDGRMTTGASSDIKEATRLIEEVINSLGMGDAGLLDTKQFDTEKSRNYEEAMRLAKQLYTDTKCFLVENKEHLQNVAAALLEKETLSEEDIDEILSVPENTSVKFPALEPAKGCGCLAPHFE